MPLHDRSGKHLQAACPFRTPKLKRRSSSFYNSVPIPGTIAAAGALTDDQVSGTDTAAAMPPGEGVRNEHRQRRCSGILGLLIVKQCVHSGHRRRSGIPDRLPTSSVSILGTAAAGKILSALQTVRAHSGHNCRGEVPRSLADGACPFRAHFMKNHPDSERNHGWFFVNAAWGSAAQPG